MKFDKKKLSQIAILLLLFMNVGTIAFLYQWNNLNKNQECYGQILVISDQRVIDGSLYISGISDGESVTYYFEGEKEEIEIGNKTENKIKIVRWCYSEKIDNYRIRGILDYGRERRD